MEFFYIFSEIEDGEETLFINQTQTRDTCFSVQRPTTTVVASLKSRSEVLEKPQNMTSKLFVPKTSDMDEGFLIFDKVNGPTGACILKKKNCSMSNLKKYFFLVSSERRTGGFDAFGANRRRHLHRLGHACPYISQRLVWRWRTDTGALWLSTVNWFWIAIRERGRWHDRGRWREPYRWVDWFCRSASAVHHRRSVHFLQQHADCAHV